MSGQSVQDRLTAAKHSIAGHGLAKSVCKATTEEVMGPKKKHIDYLVQCTNEPNVSIPQMANLLIERTQSGNWVIVFKSLITTHNVMNYGNERFTQYMASNNCTFNLGGFRDRTGVQGGYDMSTFIRRYAKYLNEKAFSYREMAFDFCKVKRGKEDGLLRSMPTDKLLKTLPVLQHLLDVLLEFDCTANELTNGVINAGFMLLFKDLIRLFACYNDGIINLLEKFFEMNKKQAKDALEIYRRFLVRMERVSEFLKVAEAVGIDKGDIPDLAKAPSSLLEALEEHLRTLESQKKSKGAPASFTSAVNTMSTSAAANTANLSEEEKKRILAEEEQHLETLKKAKSPTSPPDASNNPFLSGVTSSSSEASGGLDLLVATSPVTSPASGQPVNNDLLGLTSNNPFAMDAVAPAPAQPWGAAPAVNSMNGTNGFATQPNFAAAFGSTQVNNGTGFDGFGECLQPSNSAAASTQPEVKNDKLIQGDLDSSLASLAGNLNINSQQMKKTGQQWTSNTQNQQRTGGANWNQQPMMGFTPMGYYRAPGMMAQQPMMAGYQAPGMMAAGQMRPMMAPTQPMMYGTAATGMMPAAVAPTMQSSQPTQPNDPFGAL